MEDDETGPAPPRPDSLLPYEAWTEEALRHVVVRALAHVGAHGMPGDHHFYISFRTARPGVVIPQRLLVQYPHEMTIVLQHQYSDLQVDESEGWFSVRLTFGGIPTTLTIPFAAVSAFADPFVQFVLQFRMQDEEAANDEAAPAPPEPEPEPEPPPRSETPQVVSLDAFRKRSPSVTPKDAGKDPA